MVLLASTTGRLAVALVAACGGSSPTDGGGVGEGFAVINSDYASTSVALLDPTGQVSRGDCINSGTRPPGNTLALSGDVVLPSQAAPDHLVVTIDRTNSAVTWIDPRTCAPLRQLDVSTGFFANPHDIIAVSPTKAYVTRYERNANPTADPSDHDDGDDLLIIDPSVPRITGRIDLASYAAAGTQARPDRAQLIDGKLFVVLDEISGDFETYGAGRVVVVDPASDQVTATIDLTFENCSGLSYVAATKTLVVACGGNSRAAGQVTSSGLAFIDVTTSTITRIQPATAFGRPIAGFSAAARDGALAFAVTFGEQLDAEPKDQLWALDVATGTASKLADSADSFTYGTVLVDPALQRVYLTDANAAAPRVQVYDYATTPVREASINASPTGLPTREIAAY